MFNALLMVLLPIKHYMLAHVFDLGYSRSRVKDNRYWVVSWVYALSVELLVTVLLLHGIASHWTYAVLVIEFTALTTATLLDRFSSSRNGLKIHLYGELWLYMLLFSIGIILKI